MKKMLIVNADDFGLSPSVNYGIVECFSYGILTSTTLMINQKFTKHAIRLSKLYPKISIGLHITLDKGYSLSGVSSLTNERGELQNSQYLLKNGKEEDFYREIELQLEKFIELVGKRPTHLDTHHHIHLRNETALNAVKRIAEKYNFKYRTQEILMEEFYSNNANKAFLLSKLESEKRELTEIMCHPGFYDLYLSKISTYNLKRVDELEILLEEEIKDYIDKEYVLVNYLGEIKE
ncbi:MAG: ChbG/HpnK family deacetylase [Fusobacteriaceae bacterium]